MQITETSLAVFLAYARDAANWNGTPLIEGAKRRNLTQLKKAGLIRTFRSDGCDWIEFLRLGIELAAKHGIVL